MSRLSVWPWLRPFLILVLVISVPPVIYWFGYVQSSVTAARRQAYSTLSAVTADFKARLEAYNQIAGSADGQGSVELANYLYSLLRTRGAFAPVGPNAPHLGVGGETGGLLINVASKDCPKVTAPCALRTQIRLENLIPWNVVETDFDGLLVLSDKNQLLAQDRRLPAQALGVPVPLQVGSSPVDFDKLFKGQSPKPEGAKDGKPDAASRPSLFDFGDDASIELAGVDYTAFLQVVSVPVSTLQGPDAEGVDGEPPSVRVLVCGLIAKDRLRREAIELSPQTLVFLGSLVALGLFAIPFLKLRFIGERERMRQRDVWLLGISVLAATALLTMLVLDAHAALMLRKEFDAGLARFTEAVVRNLGSETTEAMKELRASTPALITDKISREDLRKCTEKAPSAAISRPDAVSAVLTRRVLGSYPDIEAFSELDLCGNQIRKWMARTLPTPYINNSKQPYFAPALALTEDSQAPGADGFAFSSTVTTTTGLLLGLYAVPVDRTTGELGLQVPAEKRTGVIAIGTPMRSVAAPIVAQPFEYALVDRSGAVTFHKTQRSFRGERFFESVRGGAALEVAARVRDLNAHSYSYRGKSYRMIAVDVPSLQLTLVTFYENAVVGSLATRISATAALFTLGIVISMLLGCALSMMLFDAPFDWAWPAASRIGHYAIGISVCVLSMLILVLARAGLSASWLRALMLASPAVVIILMGSGCPTRWAGSLVALIRRKVSSPETAASAAALGRSARPLLPVVFIAFGVMALIAFIAWPTLFVFTDAFDLRSAAFQTDVSNRWSAERAHWDDTNNSSVVNVGQELTGLDCKNAFDLRCSVPERIYASQQNYTKLLSLRELALYRECVSPTGGKCQTDVPPPVPFSVTASVARWSARADGERAEEARTLYRFAMSQKGSFRTPVWQGFTSWSVPGLILLVCALVLLVRSVARHVLGVDATTTPVLDEHEDFKKGAGTNWLLLRPSQEALKELRKEATVVDLRGVFEQKAFTSPVRGKTLLIEHLEMRLCDVEWRRALLVLLGSKPEGCVIVTSEIDPLYYLTQRAREKSEYLRSLPAEEKEEQEKRAAVEKAWVDLRNEIADWAVALRDVRKVRQTSPVLPKLAAGDKRVALHALLVEECTSDELIKIGERLLKRTDLSADGWEDIVGFVLDAAEPYYRSTWELCSRQERLVLIQLAEEGFVNPKQGEIVRRLARRGLVIVEPRYRLMNESFTRFVRAVEPPERVTEWERTSGKMSWSRVGTPLYALGAMVVAVLLFAEQEFFTNILAVATGGVATLGSLRSIYASVTKPAAASGKPA